MSLPVSKQFKFQVMRGGHHQKRRCVRDLVDGDEDVVHDEVSQHPSALEQKLVYKCVWGRMFPTDVQDIAHSSAMGGITHPSVLRLASLGGFGASPQHISEQFFCHYGRQARTPQVTLLSAPVVGPSESNKVVQGQVPTIYLHKWIQSLSSEYPDDFE